MTNQKMIIRVALVVPFFLVMPLALGQDAPIDTPEHVVGDQSYPFDTVDPRETERPPVVLG